MTLQKAKKRLRRSNWLLLRLKQRGECRVCRHWKYIPFLYPWPWIVFRQKAHWPAAFLAETMHKVPRWIPPGTSSGRAAGVRRRQDARATAWRWGGAAGLQPRGPPLPTPSSRPGHSLPGKEPSSKIPAAPPGRYAEGGGTCGARGGARGRTSSSQCRVMSRPLWVRPAAFLPRATSLGLGHEAWTGLESGSAPGAGGGGGGKGQKWSPEGWPRRDLGEEWTRLSPKAKAGPAGWMGCRCGEVASSLCVGVCASGGQSWQCWVWGGR